MTTHMVYLPFSYRALGRWAGSRGMVRGGVFDEGYALHVLLATVFGKAALQPFRTFRPAKASKGTLYAYSDLEKAELRNAAQAVAPPDCADVLELGRLRTKLMPTPLPVGVRLGFDIRVRPVRRIARDIRDTQAARKVIRKGSELDAFRLELLRQSPDGWRAATKVSREPGSELSREGVYGQWLAERLAGAAEVDVESCRLASFRRCKTIRGSGPGPEGPDAVLHGECTVRGADEFAARVRKGVGRHRAFGYGMLILRPPHTPPRSR